MKIHLTDLSRYQIKSKETLGFKVTGCWFDTTSWMVRYLRVEKDGGRFLLPTALLGRMSGNQEVLSLSQAAGDLKDLPRFQGDSLTREMERSLLQSLHLPCYWEGDEESSHRNYTSMIQSSDTSIQDEGVEIRDNDHFHLVCSDQFFRSHVLGTNGSIGEVTDFVLRIESWEVSCFLVEMNDSSKRIILIDPEWIDRWLPRKNEIQIDMPKEILLLEAVFDPRKEGDKRYEIDV